MRSLRHGIPLLILCALDSVPAAPSDSASNRSVPVGSTREQTVPPFGGKALDTEHGMRPAYSEEHRERYLDGRHVGTFSLFKTPDGGPLGERELDFTRSTYMPDYRFKDMRNGYEEGSRVDGDQVHVYFRDSLRAPREEKHLRVPEPRVVNGGLIPFLKQNWKVLEAGGRLPFNMVVPARLDYYRFVAYGDSTLVPSGKETRGRKCRAVVIEPQNALLRALLPSIVCVYDVATLRLVRYQGISNIADAKGRSLRVRIDYPGLGP